MSPTLHPGDYVLTWRSDRPPRRGDIVVFEDPQRADYWLVKRVVGLPGELLEIRAGKVFVDGEELHEPWTVDETGPDGSWKLGDDEVFVLGDARWLSSGDSRRLGPLPVSAVEHRVVARYWPKPAVLP
jgi:signal peptidase I